VHPHARAHPATVVAIAVAIAAVSSSGPLIVYAAAPAVAIAFWRTAMATGVLVPVAIGRRRGEIRALTIGSSRRDGVLCALAGVALALHFLCWIPSVKLTTISAATALGATQPVWQGLIAVAGGRRLSWVMWSGIGVAVAGAATATGADVGVSGRAVAGDVLAVAGGIAVAVYTALGEKARATISTTSYTAICYAVCATVLLVVCLFAGVRLGGYPASTWLALVGLTLGPQLMGHSLFNFSLRRVAAPTIAVLALLEVPGATLLGWAWLGQTPVAGAVPGLLLLVAGVAIVVLSGSYRPTAAALTSHRRAARARLRAAGVGRRSRRSM
jgi:drug/metabolite transporter (DMT)-like permease